MAEIENVNTKANAGLTTGIIGTALGGLTALGSGLFGIHQMNKTGNSDFIPRSEFDMAQKLNAKDCEIALLKSEQNTEVKIADVYAKLKGDMLTMERNQSAWNSQQMVNNATMSAAIAQNANSIEALKNVCAGITKTVVPITSVCPQPMPQFNSWTAPTN